MVKYDMGHTYVKKQTNKQKPYSSCILFAKFANPYLAILDTKSLIPLFLFFMPYKGSKALSGFFYHLWDKVKTF